MSARYTPQQGQYLAFIHHYTQVNGRPPTQADIQRYFRVSPPTVHQKILDLEAKGLLARTPGEPRALRVLLPPEELPTLQPALGAGSTGRMRGQPRRRRRAAEERAGERRALDHLRDPEARAVLHAILERHPDLGGEALALAQSVLKNVSTNEVAAAVENAVLELTLEDFDRYPSNRYEYVEPTEAAQAVLEMEVQPFLDDIARRADSEQLDAALATCVGVVLGLYRVRDGKRGELLEYAPDFPGEIAGEAVMTLRRALHKSKTARNGPQHPASLPSIFRETAAEWADALERCWRRAS
jgi:repressor LexA